VPVRHVPGAIHGECFPNVWNHIDRAGGSIVHGWCIWENPGLFIEGEFHGVWKSPSGELVDITQKKDGEREILFLIDPSTDLPRESMLRRDNVRMAMKDDPAVHQFLETAAARIEYIQACTVPDSPMLSRVDATVLRELEHKMAILEHAMLDPPVGRNDFCRCGSGEKFKKCCSR
jgi:hypothetical protein